MCYGLTYNTITNKICSHDQRLKLLDVFLYFREKAHMKKPA